MDTLYDLLGALPRDEAEDLRVAFRRAVKGTHPDIRPGDPEAALKFRQIVRANEILADPEQRAAYDHLLALAQFEKEQAAKLPIVATVHKVASGVMTFAVASIVSVGSFLLLMHMSAAFVATANDADATARVSTETAAKSPSEPSRALGANASTVKPETASLAEAITTGAAAVQGNANDKPVFNLPAPPDAIPNYAMFFRARGISAYRNGDLNGAIADLDQAIQLDPNLSTSYIDRGIVFYPLRKFDRAFANVAPAKRIEKQSRAKPATVIAAKPHPEKTASAPAATPRPPRQPVMADSVRHQWYSRSNDAFVAASYN